MNTRVNRDCKILWAKNSQAFWIIRVCSSRRKFQTFVFTNFDTFSWVAILKFSRLKLSSLSLTLFWLFTMSYRIQECERRRNCGRKKHKSAKNQTPNGKSQLHCSKISYKLTREKKRRREMWSGGPWSLSAFIAKHYKREREKTDGHDTDKTVLREISMDKDLF